MLGGFVIEHGSYPDSPLLRPPGRGLRLSISTRKHVKITGCGAGYFYMCAHMEKVRTELDRQEGRETMDLVREVVDRFRKKGKRSLAP